MLPKKKFAREGAHTGGGNLLSFGHHETNQGAEVMQKTRELNIELASKISLCETVRL